MLKLMVFVMRVMTRYAGFMARPLIQWYADREIIACGYRTTGGEVKVMYSPTKQRDDHYIVIKQRLQWREQASIDTENFSGSSVKTKLVPELENCNVIQVRAHDVNKKRIYKSPKITVKAGTKYDAKLLKITITNAVQIRFSWQLAERYQPMLYFLTVADNNDQTRIAIYTGETFWSFPKFKTASLTLSSDDMQTLKKNTRYMAKLVVVDFDGWVPVISEQFFFTPSG